MAKFDTNLRLEECGEWMESVGLATGLTPRPTAAGGGAAARTPGSPLVRGGALTPSGAGAMGYPAHSIGKTPAGGKPHVTPLPMRMTGGLQKMTKDSPRAYQ